MSSKNHQTSLTFHWWSHYTMQLADNVLGQASFRFRSRRFACKTRRFSPIGPQASATRSAAAATPTSTCAPATRGSSWYGWHGSNWYGYSYIWHGSSW